MEAGEDIYTFLSNYDSNIADRAVKLRDVVIANLPGITEQPDQPAKMIAYCYGQKYAELICTIIPSKKGLKLGFNRGTLLPDPTSLLQGTGKISRYVVIATDDDVRNPAIVELLKEGFRMYKEIRG